MADISVAIATRNRPEGVLRCVRAILDGTKLPREVVIVDQSDPSARIATEIPGGKRPEIRYRAQDPEGLSASRNAALELSRSPVVAFTDDDCVPERDWVANIARAFDERSPAAVAGRILPLDAASAGFPVSLRTSRQPLESNRPCTAPWLLGSGGNLAVARGWIKKVGGFDERLGAGSGGRAGEDIDLLYRLLRAGGRVRYEPRIVVRHALQTRDRRRSSRADYGWGVGASCGMQLGRQDLLAAAMLGRWVTFRLRRGATAALVRDWELVYEEALVLAGTLGGVVFGLASTPGKSAPLSRHRQQCGNTETDGAGGGDERQNGLE